MTGRCSRRRRGGCAQVSRAPAVAACRVGLSGGIDSAVSLALAARALGPENVIAIRMPTRHTEQVHLDDAEPTARRLRAAAREHADDLDRAGAGGHRAARPARARRRRCGSGTPARAARMILIYDVAQEYDGAGAGHREPQRVLPRLLHPLRRRRVGHRADLRPLQDRGAARRRAARPAGGGDHQAPDGRPVGRPDRRAGARLHATATPTWRWSARRSWAWTSPPQPSAPGSSGRRRARAGRVRRSPGSTTCRTCSDGNTRDGTAVEWPCDSWASLRSS